MSTLRGSRLHRRLSSRRTLRYSRLRTAHDSTVRDIVASSWDTDDTRRRVSTRARNTQSYASRADAARVFLRATNTLAPNVDAIPVGKDWSLDLVVIVHNAVRVELAELFEIVACLASSSTYSVAELRAFFAWFSTFEAFVVTGLKAEEEVLYPWLEQWGRIEGNLSTAHRITTKGAVIRGVRDVAACAALVGLHRNLPQGVVLTNPDRKYYDSLKVGFAEVGPAAAAEHDARICADVIHKVISHVARFSTILMRYFAEEERVLPPIIDSLYESEDARAAQIHKRTMRAIWKCGRKDESIVMLVRAMDDRAYAKQWVAANLRRIDRMSLPVWRRRFFAGRGAVVLRFRQRHPSAESDDVYHAECHAGKGVESPRGSRLSRLTKRTRRRFPSARIRRLSST